MKRFLLSLFIFLSVGFAAAPFSLEKRSVRHYTINEGLASNAVYSIYQDSKGLIWIGTIDGLHSFDGYRIREWRDASLPSLGPIITDICEDGRERLWVGSRSGLSILDLRKEKFHTLDINPESGVGLNASVTGIIRDSGGEMWLSTDAGVFRYDLDTKMLRQYPAISKIRSDMVRCIMEDSRGRIWAGTQQGLCLYNKVHDRFLPSGNYARVDVSSLFEDSKGVIWVGSRGAGLYRLSGSDGSLECVLHPADSNSLLNVRSIVEREPGELLIASDQGLTVFDTNDGSSRILRSENPGDKLNDNYIHRLFIDRENALWIGTYFGGINYVAPQENLFSSYHISNAHLGAKIVSVIAKAKDNDLWIGTDDAGVFHWNRSENRFTPLGNRKLGEGSAYKNIHALLEVDDKLFVGMYLGGLDIIDLKTGKTRNHTIGISPRSLYSSSIYSLLHDSKGNIWVGTPSGLNRYCPETDDFERVFEVHPADVTCLMEDARGNIWACTSNAGIFRLNSSSGKWVQLNPGGDTGADGVSQPMSVITASCDAAGNVWFGMDGDGLYRYDHKSETFKKEGVPQSIRVVNKIIPFGEDLWLATSKGLWRYNPVSGAASYYDKYSGLQDNVFLPNSGIRDGESVFVGSVNGFNEFKPAEIRKTAHSPQVILSDLQIFNKPVMADEDGSLHKESITYADRLVLNHDELVVSFRVSPLSYVNPSANKIQYKLEGFDKDWIDEDPSIPISYTNLPSGSYTFRVRTSDGTGGWNIEALAFPVNVLPPWWWSTPMIIIYVALFIGLLAYIYLKLLHRQKEKLRILADQKDRELYRSKMEFFTHIIHEIRTPLTLILSPLDQLLDTSGNSGSRQQLKVMKRNGERLLNLVNHLMDFRKMESKERVDLKISDHDIAGRLQHICENFSPAAQAKRLKVDTIIPAGRCMAKVDPEAFTQIVSNLLSNALKFARGCILVKLNKFTPPPSGLLETYGHQRRPGYSCGRARQDFYSFLSDL